MDRRPALVLGVLLLSACGGGSAQPGNPDANPNCPLTDASVTCPTDGPSYETVQGIFASRCVPCHDDRPDGNWPLMTYDQVFEWSDVILRDLNQCTMPPADGGIAVTAEERLAILLWAGCGAAP